MDQEQAFASLTSFPTKQLNARAPEFVPRSAATATATVPPAPVFQHIYPTPSSFLPPLPQPFYGYESYLLQNVMPFYEYNGNPTSLLELLRDRNNSTIVVSPRNELSDAHRKILSQVEYYFGDINLATTDQLFKLMSKDPEGYVPISFIASFKKIKSGINGNTQLANILQTSKKLLVSKDGKKVKRKDRFTESDLEELQSRIVIAENLPEDHSHQNLMNLFSSVGSVKSIRTSPPQKSNDGTSPASKTGKGDPMHFSSKLHAFVEYETVELAEKAVVELKDESDWRNGLKVRLMHRSVAHTGVFDDKGKHTQARSKKYSIEGDPNGKKDVTNALEMQHKDNNVGDVTKFDTHFHERQWEDNGSSNVQRKGLNYFGSSFVSKEKGKGQGRGWIQHSANGGSTSGTATTEISMSTEKLTRVKTFVVPRMPDGTKGFSIGRGKPIAVKIA